MNQRNHDGSLITRDHLLRRPLVVESAEDVSSCFNSGGAGCFAKPRDYCREPLTPPSFSPLSVSIYLGLTQLHRNPQYTAQQWNFAYDRCPNPIRGNGQRDVPKPDRGVSQLRLAGNSSLKARLDKSHPAYLPCPGKPAAGLGAHDDVDERGCNWEINQCWLLGWPAESMVVV